MRSKIKQLTNFSQALQTTSTCYRPDNEKQVAKLVDDLHHSNQLFLTRGKGLSYNDCCLNDQGIVIDASRLNHFASFDEKSGIVECQGSVSFADLFLIHPDYIPPVIPGTQFATLAGGVANDVHGKNNVHCGSFGQHVVEMDLQIGDRSLRVNHKTHADLFEATIGGLGLTGLIKRVAVKLQKASRFVQVQSEKHHQWETLVQRMQQEAQQQTYQVAWLDLLNPQRALLTLANHTRQSIHEKHYQLSVPPLPIGLVYGWNMKLFNQFYFQRKIKPSIQSLQHFNNPLDSIKNWNRLYGKKGLLQFQAVVNEDCFLAVFNELYKIIQTEKATPTLSVLKYFGQTGAGLLSFVQPGFTLAIDFINNEAAQSAIKKMNALITSKEGKVYLAKDLFLNPEQFKQQYPNHEAFQTVLGKYQPGMQSTLSRRLGISL